MRRWKYGWMMAFLLLVMAACGRSASPAEETVLMPPDVVEMPLAEKAAPAPGLLEAGVAVADRAAPQAAAEVERLVIYTADLVLSVDDPQQAASEVAKLAEHMGGYVVSMETYTVGAAEAAVEATVTVRVPAERYREALARIEGLAVRVEHRSEHSQDVTEEYVDLDARLHNLRVAEAKLQEIMDQATRTEDVLRVYQELVRIREQIEVLEGRKRYLEQSSAMARITVTLRRRPAATPVSSGGWEPQGVLKEALQALLRTLQALSTALIWLVLYVLPLALLAGLVLWPFYALWRRRRRTRAQ